MPNPLPTWTPGNAQTSNPATSRRVFNFNNMTQSDTANRVQRVNRARDLKQAAAPASTR